MISKETKLPIKSIKTRITEGLGKFAKSRILKKLLVSSFGSILMRGTSIILAPITMSILDPKDYGIIALSTSFVFLFSVLSNLGLKELFMLEYFHSNGESRKILLNNILLIYLVFSIPIILLFSLYPKPINNLFFMGDVSSLMVILIMFYAFLSFFTELFYNTLSYRGQVFQLTVIQTVTALGVIALNLLLLCWFKLGVLSILIGQLIGMIAVSIIAFCFYLKKSCHLYIKPNVTISSLPGYLKISLSYIPGLLCASLLASSDRWVLARYSGMHDVGIYSLAAVFGQLFQMVVLIPLGRAYVPAVLDKFSKNRNDIASVERWNKKNMIFAMVGLTLLCSVGYIVCKPLLYKVLPLRYQPAIDYIWLILMGYIFLLGEHFVSILITFRKKAYFQAASFALPSLLNLGLNVALVPYLNITGCVIATLVSYASFFLIKLFYNMHLQNLSDA